MTIRFAYYCYPHNKTSSVLAVYYLIPYLSKKWTYLNIYRKCTYQFMLIITNH